MIAGGTSFSASSAAPRPEAAAVNGASRPPAEAANATTATPDVPAAREAATSARAVRSTTDDATGSAAGRGADFALLLAGGQTPGIAADDAPPPATAAAAATAPCAEPVATPDQWLAMLAGALAMPVAVNAPEASASAPSANIPTSANPIAVPLANPAGATAATPAAAAAATPPALDLAVEAAAGELAKSADAAPAFETVLNGVAAPASVAAAPMREVAPPPPPLQMPAEPAAGFDEGIGTHLAWMAGQKLGEARIQVSPDHLGPIEVTLQLDDTRVDAQFHSTHVEVRAALEASVPRLRELLAQHGLQLGQADVGQRQQAPQGQSAGHARSADGQGEAAPATTAPMLRRRGLLDEYA